jgi:hypothetical protein
MIERSSIVTTALLEICYRALLHLLPTCKFSDVAEIFGVLWRQGIQAETRKWRLPRYNTAQPSTLKAMIEPSPIRS